jgi:hypothetical protein
MLAQAGFVALVLDDTACRNAPAAAQSSTNQLWGFSPFGVGLWNAMRAVDYLDRLPGVDPKRIGAAGGGDGGRMAILLAGVEQRISALSLWGLRMDAAGEIDACVAAPGLHARFSDTDFAAIIAPRPLQLVSGEGGRPAVDEAGLAAVYMTLGKPDCIRGIHLDATAVGEDFTTAAERWFRKWLQGDGGNPKAAVQIAPEEIAPAPAPFPAWDRAASEWVIGKRRILDSVKPSDTASLARFQGGFGYVGWEAMTQADEPEIWVKGGVVGGDELTVATTGERIPFVFSALSLAENTDPPRWSIILAAPEGLSAFNPGGIHATLASSLVLAGCTVLTIDPGRQQEPGGGATAGGSRTPQQRRSRAFRAATAYAKGTLGARKTILVGFGSHGLDAILSTPVADAVAADFGRIDPLSEGAWLGPDRFTPGILEYGGPGLALAQSAPKPAMLFNAGLGPGLALAESAYEAARDRQALEIQTGIADDLTIFRWIRSVMKR